MAKELGRNTKIQVAGVNLHVCVGHANYGDFVMADFTAITHGEPVVGDTIILDAWAIGETAQEALKRLQQAIQGAVKKRENTRDDYTVVHVSPSA